MMMKCSQQSSDRYSLVDQQFPPISKTTRYKKITKPLLERKRRARINHCLDELKHLMAGAFEAEGENINKLEKADILELTVKHLHGLTRSRNPIEDAHTFQAGFSQCANETRSFLSSNLPTLECVVSGPLLRHLKKCTSESSVTTTTSTSHGITSDCTNAGSTTYTSGRRKEFSPERYIVNSSSNYVHQSNNSSRLHNFEFSANNNNNYNYKKTRIPSCNSNRMWRPW